MSPLSASCWNSLPTFKLNELRPSLGRSKFPRLEADAILRYFRPTDLAKDDYWAAFLLPIDDASVVPLVAPLTAPNLLYLIERWMKAGKIDLSKKGPLFESVVRDTLGRAISESRKLKMARVWNRSVVIELTTGAEEIDVVIQIGSTFLIGELKCDLFPAEPYDVYLYYSMLESAGTQAKRKASAAQNNQAAFFKALGISAPPKISSVLPFVLVNQPLGAGHSVDGVPVTDVFLMRRFLDEGEVENLGRLDEQGLLIRSVRTSLYEDDASAETAKLPDTLTVRLMCRSIIRSLPQR